MWSARSVLSGKPSVVILDTNALIYDALRPQRLSRRARKAIERGDASGRLAISDITLWEVAMLIERGRLRQGATAEAFLNATLRARSILVLPIVPEIAVLAQTPGWQVGDPADRIIAATTVHHRGQLVTSDERLRDLPALSTIW